MKSKVKNLLLFFFSLLVFLVVLESVFRLARREDAFELATGRADTRYHHSLPSNHKFRLISSQAGEYDVIARINQYGFRGEDFDSLKKPGQRRIFILGDSFAFGAGVRDNETIPARLQNILDPVGKRIEVINAGIPSYSPLTHYLKLRDDIPRFKPDVVVMLLDFSDLRDDWDIERNLIYDHAGEIIGANPYYEYGAFHLWNFLRTKSVMCKYLHNKVVRTFQKLNRLGLNAYILSRLEGRRAKAVIAHQEGDAIEFDGRLFMRGRAKANEIRKHFERTGKYILMSRALAQKHGVKLILVMYPYGTYVGPHQWNEGRVFWGFQTDWVDQDYFAFELVQEFARQNEIPFVNLLKDFIRYRDEELFFPYDGHFTARGSQVAAEALAPYLESSLRGSVPNKAEAISNFEIASSPLRGSSQ